LLDCGNQETGRCDGGGENEPYITEVAPNLEEAKASVDPTVSRLFSIVFFLLACVMWHCVLWMLQNDKGLTKYVSFGGGGPQTALQVKHIYGSLL